MNTVNRKKGGKCLRKQYLFGSRMVGLPGFGPGSLAPEAKSLDQASRQPLLFNLRYLQSW